MVSTVIYCRDYNRGQHGVDGGEFRGANRGEARDQMGDHHSHRDVLIDGVGVESRHASRQSRTPSARRSRAPMRRRCMGGTDAER
jgi:hypothetical protein